MDAFFAIIFFHSRSVSYAKIVFSCVCLSAGAKRQHLSKDKHTQGLQNKHYEKNKKYFNILKQNLIICVIMFIVNYYRLLKELL